MGSNPTPRTIRCHDGSGREFRKADQELGVIANKVSETLKDDFVGFHIFGSLKMEDFGGSRYCQPN